MFTLYGRPGTGAAAIEALLEELGLEWRYELVQKLPDGSNPPEFLALNPRGEVPALRLPDGSVMTESAAIMLYLADLKPGFAPAAADPARAAYLRWMVYLAANSYMSDLRAIYPQRYTTQSSGAEGISAAAKQALARDCEILSQALGEKPFFLGQQFTALDLYAAMIMGWAMQDIEGIPQHANLAAHLERLKQRPATGAAFGRNKL